MRILVHEWFSGGSLAGEPLPRAIAREGAAIRDALLSDLAALGRHQIVATLDPRFPLRRGLRGVEAVRVASPGDSSLDDLMAATDAVWLIAPETGDCLEGLARRARASGALLLGPTAAAIRRASDKASLPRRFAAAGVPHPKTCVVGSSAEARAAARAIGFPVVAKPARGAGCDGVGLARTESDVEPAFRAALGAAGGGSVLLQRYVAGLAASVSLLGDGRRNVVLAVNAQRLRASEAFRYRGGTTPLDHPLATEAARVALRACHALAGLRGYVGVDVVLTRETAVVIEVNPRLTTAYLGVRATLDANLAGLALEACAGALPASPVPRRQVRFSAAGRIVAA